MSEIHALIEDKVKVIFEDIGEGWNGDYNPDDPDDVSLYRFDVFAHESLKNEYAEDSMIEDGYGFMLDSSYCTQMPTNTPKPIMDMALKRIMEEVKDAVIDGYSIKKICEGLSWLSPSDFQPDTSWMKNE